MSRLSTIVVSDAIVELSINEDFDDLLEAAQIEIMNTAQQLVTDDYNKSEKKNYLVSTLGGAIAVAIDFIIRSATFEANSIGTVHTYSQPFVGVTVEQRTNYLLHAWGVKTIGGVETDVGVVVVKLDDGTGFTAYPDIDETTITYFAIPYN